jgi:hypothetical protein
LSRIFQKQIKAGPFDKLRTSLRRFISDEKAQNIQKTTENDEKSAFFGYCRVACPFPDWEVLLKSKHLPSRPHPANDGPRNPNVHAYKEPNIFDTDFRGFQLFLKNPEKKYQHFLIQRRHIFRHNGFFGLISIGLWG